MFSIRKVKTKSGATAIQVVQYVGHRCKVYKHIGSTKDDLELAVLKHAAQKGYLHKLYRQVYSPNKIKKFYLLIWANVLL